MALDVKGTEKELPNPRKLEELHSKKSSLSCSSRLSYYRSPEGVPFQWEKQPGKAIDPPKEDILPPLSPPPAVLSLGLPIPNISVNPEPNKKTSLLLKFWKRIKKSNQGREEARDIVNKRVECYSSEEEFMVSPRNNSSCSSSFSLSFSNDQTRQMGLDGSIGGSMRRPFGCGVMSFPSILVAFTKRP